MKSILVRVSNATFIMILMPSSSDTRLLMGREEIMGGVQVDPNQSKDVAALEV
jgi:hypothetical protein